MKPAQGAQMTSSFMGEKGQMGGNRAATTGQASHVMGQGTVQGSSSIGPLGGQSLLSQRPTATSQIRHESSAIMPE